jgi:hypothetical protein
MDTPDLTAGMVLDGRYEIESVLGRGGMASVYRARDTLLGRVVAIKLFSPTGADAAELRRETSEVQVLAGLAHPAIVTLFDARVDDADRAYLVMEFVDGPTLQSLVSDGPLAPATAAAMLADLGEALHVAHEGGVVHRDVKPANILLAPVPGGEGRYRAKLADFGIAYLVDSTRLTATGTVMGTAAFISPEQALGQPIGPPSDVYSLGLVALEALTGSRVFTGSAIESVMARLHNDPIVPSSLEAGWASLLTSMTARDPEARPTALDVSRRASRLASAARGGDTADLAAVPDPTEPLSPRDRTMVVPAAAAAAAAGAGVGAAAAGAGAAQAAGNADAPTAAYGANAPTAADGADAPTAAYGANAPTAAYGANAPTSSYSDDAPGSDAPTERFAPAVGVGAAATGGGVAAGSGAGGTGIGGGAGDRDRASSGRPGWILPVIIVAVLALIAGAVVWGVSQGSGGDGAPVETSSPASTTPTDEPSGETTPSETTAPEPEQTAPAEEPAPAQPSETVPEQEPAPASPSESTDENEPDENEPDENEPDENPIPEVTVPGTDVGTGSVTGPGNSGSNPNSGPGNNNGNGNGAGKRVDTVEDVVTTP